MISLTVSIITISHNSIETINNTISSVLSQTYKNIEYIIIDGASVDGTIDLIQSFGKKISIFLSEPDNGIYDALNKGIKLATGDIIGILNSDDFFHNDSVIERVVAAFMHQETDAIFGDVVFVNPLNTSKVVRHYSSKHFSTARFKFGFMPAHPSFYVKRSIYEKLGYYKTDYKIAADFELLIRFMFVHKIRCRYLEFPLVSMRMGGVSNKSVLSNIILNKEIFRACKENGIRTNYFFIYSKYLTKIFEYSNKRVTRSNILI
jgi:glycosyltransferase involved in cell wall biosynthesis